MFQYVAKRVPGHHTGADLRRWLVLGLVGVIVALGLVALGRWTAPSTVPTAHTSAPAVQATGAGSGSIDPAVMREVRQTLEQAASVVYLGTSLPEQVTGVGQTSIDTAVMSPRRAQQEVERFYSGAPLPGTTGVIDPAVKPSRGVQQVLEHFYLGTPLPRNASK